MSAKDESEDVPRDQASWAPRVSVVIPLEDDRQQASWSVASWAREQSFPRERYEVIAVSGGLSPLRDERVRALLAPHDQLLLFPRTSPPELYNAGAVAARGQTLFLTEPHVIAHRDCVAEMIRFLDAHAFDGALCGSDVLNDALLARMEERLFAQEMAERLHPDHWNKLSVRGFAMDRRRFVREGMFEPGLRRFSAAALAARLHARGLRFGYAEQAWVWHANHTRLGGLFDELVDYGRGEAAFRAAFPPAHVERYLGADPEWTLRELSRAENARTMSWDVLKNLPRTLAAGQWGKALEHARFLVHQLPTALWGPRAAVLRATLSRNLAVLRMWLWAWHPERRFEAFQEACEGTIRIGRLAEQAQQLAEPRTSADNESAYDLPSLDPAQMAGFHDVERWNDRAFRWSAPEAMLHVAVEPGAYEVALDALPLRPDSDPLGLDVFFDRRHVASFPRGVGNSPLVFRIDKDSFEPGVSEHRLVFLTDAWKTGDPAGPQRVLGLPLCGVRFTPVDPPHARLAGPTRAAAKIRLEPPRESLSREAGREVRRPAAAAATAA